MKLNLKTVMINTYPRVMDSLIKELSRKDKFHLQSLVMCGGSVHTDNLVSHIQRLTLSMRDCCPHLENLHLPVTSNLVLKNVSQMRIKAFKSDRTRSLNRTGLYYLCQPGTESRDNLQVLHLGIFKHSFFEKQDVAEFVRCMTSLREFSLMDRERALVRLEATNTPGDKVLTYSAFKLAIRDSGEERLVTNLSEMSVVDRSLKPFYLLESAPLLARLSIDWQQELSFPPFNRFKPDWFSQMLRTDPSWALLANKLTKLDVTFPASHSINSYSLPLEDFTKLMENLSNLEELRLEGAGQGGPLPLIAILHYCPLLKDLTLKRTPVHVPDNFEIIDWRGVSSSLERFYYLGEMSSLLVHNYMTTAIAIYMPHLIELEVQPQTVLGYAGLTPQQVKELSSLARLHKLAVPLSVRSCEMNLPELIFVLREFRNLRYLTLSWGLSHESYDINRSKISYMMSWLANTLSAENVDINLQLSYRHHPQEFRSH